MHRLREWRESPAEPSTAAVFRIRRTVGAARVRTQPTRSSPAALDGNARMYPGDVLVADRIVEGEAIDGERRWAHRQDGLGYVHLSLLSPMR